MTSEVRLAALSQPGVRSSVGVEADNGFVRLQVQHLRRDDAVGGDLVDGVQVVLTPLVAAHLARALVDAVDEAGGVETA